MVFCGACAPTGEGRAIEGPTGAPAVRLVATTSLRDSTQAPLGGYLFASRSSAGRILVSDMANSRIVVFGPDGALEHIWGRKGNGPGEFQAPGVNVVLYDSLLAVWDVAQRQISLLDASDGQFIRAATLPGGDVGVNWTVRGDSALFALGSSPGLFARWEWTTGKASVGGTVPAQLLTDPFTTLQHGRPEIALTAQGIVALLPTEPGVRLLSIDGRDLGLVRLPWVRRKGTPADLFAKAAAARESGPMGLAPVGSAVVGLRALSNGSLLALLLDVEQLAPPREGRPGAQLFGNFKLFASLIRGDLSAACVDAPVPIDTDVPPFPFFSGDTLWVLTRKVLPADTVLNQVQGFVVGDKGCDWMATGGPDTAQR